MTFSTWGVDHTACLYTSDQCERTNGDEEEGIVSVNEKSNDPF